MFKRQPGKPHWTQSNGVSPNSRRMFLRNTALSVLLLGVGGRLARAGENLWMTFQTPEAFLTETFGAAVPPAKLLDLDGTAQAKLSAVLGHPYAQGRLRYWRGGGRSAWILEDIGKQGYQVTTAGFVVKGGAIDFARVLIYRESRGEQVAEPSFLKQLSGAHLAGTQLDRSVDNISGATLSVKMMQRMASAALTLDSFAP